MALDRGVASLVSQSGVLDQFRSAELAQAGRALVAAWDSHASSASAIDQLPTRLLDRVTAGLLGEGAMANIDRMQAARDCIDKIWAQRPPIPSRQLRVELSQAVERGDETTIRERLRLVNDDLLRRKEIGHG